MKNILLLGDIVIDKYYFGQCKRLAPEGPFPVVVISQITNKLGCLGNVLENIKDFFDKIYLITCINEKTIQPLVNKIKDYHNIEHFNIHQDNRNLIKKNRIFADNQYISRFDEEIINNINHENEKKFINYIENIICDIDIVLISDYKKGFLTYSLTQNIINLANKNGKATFIDPKGNDYTKYKNCTLIKPNKQEAIDFFKKNITDENINEFSNKILNDLNIKFILNTLGNEGMRFIEKTVSSNKNSIIYKNIIPSQVVDVTGCGDTILAGICVYYNKYGNFKNKHYFLDILSKLGNIAVNTANCYNLTKQDWNSLLTQKKGKIVFTNGCFDIIHIGHLRYLKECKKYGSKLIIGINTDESIKRLKGKNRPINTLNDRISFLKELEIADEIIPFSEDTPENLLKKIKPDYMIKGGDYSIEEIIGKEFAKEVKIIPFINGYSSTNIIDKCKNIKI
jgi:D-beta-D-heptose 7-phosphate kinase/D-beta-D-heptose 1-phosphate adenosyltransferase